MRILARVVVIVMHMTSPFAFQVILQAIFEIEFVSFYKIREDNIAYEPFS